MKRLLLSVLSLSLVLLAGAPVRADAPLLGEEAVLRAAAQIEASTVVLRVTRIGLLGASQRAEWVTSLRTDPGTPPAPVTSTPTFPTPMTLTYVSAPPEARGFFVGDGSAVLTSASAVHRASKVEAIRDGRAVELAVAAIDPDFDLAVLKGDLRGPPLEIDGSSVLEPGRLLVIGAAGEKGVGIDVAVVSSRVEDAAWTGYGRLVRALPPESVGAPVLGADGRVRGLVAIPGGGRGASSYYLLADSHGARGVADPLTDADRLREAPWRLLDLAAYSASGVRRVPPDTTTALVLPGQRIARALPELLAEGRVHKAYLGLVIGAPPAPGQRLDLRRVARVLPDSPVKEVVLPGDRILAVGDRRLGSTDDLYYEILALEPGRPARITVEREGREVVLDVVPSERAGAAAARGPTAFGFEVLPLTPELRAWLGQDAEGVIVSAVTPGGPAQRAGMHRGDRLVRLADRDVRSAADADAAADEALRRLAAGSPVTAEVVRDGTSQTLRFMDPDPGAAPPR